MSATLIDGKKIAAELTDKIKVEVAKLPAGKRPGLAVVLVGDDPASQSYVNSKEKKCQELGFYSVKIELPAKTSEEELLKLVESLNADPKIHGILVQLPLPKPLSEQTVINAILPKKDVDGLHPLNLGRLLRNEKTIESCTPRGVIKLIKSTAVEIAGKRAVVLGRSNMVGKPIAALLLNEDATVTICHRQTADLKAHLMEADIVVLAVGKPGLVSGAMLKKGAVVIDVGTTRGADGKLHGDADFGSVAKVASFITPVPGGVGPMTIACLMENTYEAFRNSEF